MMHEIKCGPVSKQQARAMRDQGGYAVPMVLEIDAMSVFAAITATYIKHPSEKSLLSHVQFMRELLDTGVLKAISWTDTRDMAADGLTKGTVDRAALHEIMSGFMTYKHEHKIWQSNLSKSTSKLMMEVPISE